MAIYLKASSTEQLLRLAENGIKVCPRADVPKLSVKLQADIFEKQVTEISDKIANYSKQLYETRKENFDEYYKILKTVFDFDDSVKVTGRLKSTSSIASKLNKRSGKLPVNYDEEKLLKLVPDICAYRATLDNFHDMDLIQSHIAEMIETFKFEPGVCLNKGENPMFGPLATCVFDNMGFFVKESNRGPKNFAVTNLTFLKNNVPAFELQITGTATAKLAEKEHKFYNFKTKGAAFENGKIDKKMNKIFKSMTQEQMDTYSKYIDDCYNWARMQDFAFINKKRGGLEVYLNPSSLKD